jgi:hypothetical protein
MGEGGKQKGYYTVVMSVREEGDQNDDYTLLLNDFQNSSPSSISSLDLCSLSLYVSRSLVDWHDP